MKIGHRWLGSLRSLIAAFGAVLWLIAAPLALGAQEAPAARSLSLQEALERASGESEQVTIAQAGVRRAQGRCVFAPGPHACRS